MKLYDTKACVQVRGLAVPCVKASPHSFSNRLELPCNPVEMPKPTALITGCSRGGLGDALASQLAERGHHVFAAVRNPSKAVHFADAQDIEVVVLDVTSSESINSLVNNLKDRLTDGKLDILINSAGVVATGPLIEVDLAMARQLYDVNVHGLLAMTQAFAPMLIAAKGKLVNLSSIGGLLPLPWGGMSVILSLFHISREKFPPALFCYARLDLQLYKPRCDLPLARLIQDTCTLRRLRLLQSRCHHHERDATSRARTIRRDRHHGHARPH